MKPYPALPGSRRVRAALLAFLLLLHAAAGPSLALLAAVAPLALAQETPASPASFLAYRPWPDARDELGTALAPPPFDASRLPVTRVDRVATASPAPENRPESAPAHYREMLRLVQAAEAAGAPVTLEVSGGVAPGTMEVRVVATPTRTVLGEVELALVVFEHGVEVAGRAHPYVARFALEPAPLSLPGNATFDVRLDRAWNLDRLGVVVLVRNASGVLQSATWMPRQADAVTHQVAKAPLVEHVTASWCAPCAPADEAFLLLATQRGAAGPLAGSAEASYLRAPTGWLWAGLAAGLIAAFLLVGRRAR